MTVDFRSKGSEARVLPWWRCGHRRRPGRGGDGSSVEGKRAPVVIGLGKGHDGVQKDTAESVA